MKRSTRPARSRRRPLAAERLEARAMLAVTPALLDSWFVSGQGEFAQIYAGQAGGTVVGPSTTWASQTSPVIGDVQKVSFSNATDTVYVNAPDLASYVMGAWWGNTAQTQPFVNLPKDQNAIYKITLNTTYPSATHSIAGNGAVGIAVNGVVFYNAGDAFSYSHANASEINAGDGLFNRLAAAVESVTFDSGNGHQPGNGQYHYHEDPVALRAQLGDNVDYVGTTNYFPYDPGVYYLTHGQGADGDFREHTTNLQHSPIIGWMFDGHPIYGPYGYTNPTDPTSTVTRMRSSFSLRNITERTTLPGWAAELSGGKLGATAAATPADGTYTMTLAQQGQYAGPAVSATYPLGRYGEDYAYVTGSGDLDQFNGRWCRTPEFPNGTYAYFITIDAVGEPAFPYVVNRQYYGQTNGSGKVTSITEPVTVSFDVATNVAPVVSGPAAFAVTQSATLPLTNALRVSVSDVDAAAVESVALAASAGTLGLDLTGILASRVTVVSGANNSASISISGALDELNAALATLTYTAPVTGTAATLTVQANDGSAANNLSTTLTVAITLNSNGPAAPTFALAADTGSSATDGVTNNGQIDVSGLEAGATWEYSTNGGAAWTAGTGSSFTLSPGTYAQGVISVRQTTGAGTSAATSSSRTIVVDVSAAAPALALAVDTGVSGSDGVTTDGRVTVSGIESGATWQSSTNGGGSWAAGSGSSFTLPAGIYAAGAVRVRQTDRAGNTSVPAQNGVTWNVDQTPPAVQSATAAAGPYSAGQTVTISVTFAEGVYLVGGSPTLSLNTGATAALVTPVTPGSTVLQFRSVVSAGESTAALAVTAFNLGGATLSDKAGNTPSAALVSAPLTVGLAPVVIDAKLVAIAAQLAGSGSPAGPTLTTPPTSLVVVFNAPVVNFTTAALRLYWSPSQSGTPTYSMSLAGASIRMIGTSGTTYVLTLPKAAVSAKGSYMLVIDGSLSNIRSAANSLAAMTTPSKIYFRRS